MKLHAVEGKKWIIPSAKCAVMKLNGMGGYMDGYVWSAMGKL
jgi:hypothetical protein